MVVGVTRAVSRAWGQKGRRYATRSKLIPTQFVLAGTVNSAVLPRRALLFDLTSPFIYGAVASNAVDCRAPRRCTAPPIALLILPAPATAPPYPSRISSANLIGLIWSSLLIKHKAGGELWRPFCLTAILVSPQRKPDGDRSNGAKSHGDVPALPTLPRLLI